LSTKQLPVAAHHLEPTEGGSNEDFVTRIAARYLDDCLGGVDFHRQGTSRGYIAVISSKYLINWATEREVIHDGASGDIRQTIHGCEKGRLEGTRVTKASQYITLLDTISGGVVVYHATTVTDKQWRGCTIGKPEHTPQRRETVIIKDRAQHLASINSIEGIGAVDM
jgi:hypothetical protein